MDQSNGEVHCHGRTSGDESKVLHLITVAVFGKEAMNLALSHYQLRLAWKRADVEPPKACPVWVTL